MNFTLTDLVLDWFSDVDQEITVESGANTKPRLYCDSTFMQYMPGGDVVPNSGGKTLNQVYDKKYVCKSITQSKATMYSV